MYSVTVLDYCLTNVGSSASGDGVGNLLQELNTDNDLRTLIFHSQSISSDGRISAWELFAVRPGTVYILVFRSLGGDNFEFVGKNKITVQTTGYQVSHLYQTLILTCFLKFG